MDNLVRSDDTLDFWVWVDPRRSVVRRQVERHGCFSTVGDERGQAGIAPHPESVAVELGGLPLATGVQQPYAIEHLLEAVRQAAFVDHPSRLNAIHLFRSESDAAAYRAQHVMRTQGQRLKRVSTSGAYVYSSHDGRWLQAMRRSGDRLLQQLDCACRYWRGSGVDGPPPGTAGLLSPVAPLEEVLYLGTVEFYDTWMPLP